MALEHFIGKWREDTREGFEDFAKKINLADDKAAWYKSIRTELTFERDGETWCITLGMVGDSKTRVFKFKLGESYDSANIDGTPMKSVIIAEGSKFIEKHTSSDFNGEPLKIERWVEGNTMIVNAVCKGALLQSRFKKI